MDNKNINSYAKIMLLVFTFIITNISFMVAQDGFGGNVTGGEGGRCITVTDIRDFEDNACFSDEKCVITVSGTISAPYLFYFPIKSNKTIQGADSNATINGNLYLGRSGEYAVTNVIIKNLNITNPNGVGDGDGITILNGVNRILITHCTFTDCADGSCDITMGSDNVTVSWCRFRYVNQTSHWYVNLIGANDAHTEDIDRLHVTFHHNWYDQGCVERMPSVRYGRAHVYNNYFGSAGNYYCVRTRLNAECLVENNYFENVQNPWELLLTTGATGKLYASGNNVSFLDTSYGVKWVSGWYEGQILIPGNDDVFTPPYSYTLDNAQDVKSKVTAFAGNVQPLVLNNNGLNFGTVQAGSNATQSVTVTNTSTTNTVSITGVSSVTGYSIVPIPPASYPIMLAPGANCTFDVTFLPSLGVIYSGNIIFAHDGQGGIIALYVYGKGQSAGPEFILDKNSLALGNVLIGGSSTQSVKVVNSGSTNTLSITGVTAPMGYSIVPNPAVVYPISVAAGASQNFDVIFTPPSVGTFTGDVVFAHNAIGGTTNLYVSGSSVDPALMPESFAWTLESGDSVTTTMMIQNTGSIDLNWKIYLQAPYRLQNKINVAIIQSEWNATLAENLKSKLLATGRFNGVDIINVGTYFPYTQTPTLQQLKAYKALLLFNTYGWRDPAAMGNVLAEYLEDGGGVVWAYRISNDGNFSQYQLIPVCSYTTSAGSLGTVNLPSHPLIQGVTEITAASYRPTPTTLSPGTIKVADWNDGLPLIVYKDSVGPSIARRVDLGFSPVYSDVTGESSKIIANALHYVQTAENYVIVSPDTGTISPGLTQTIQVKFNAKYLSGGNYNAKILLTSKGFVHTAKEIPINLEVIGNPVISVVPDTVKAGVVFLGLGINHFDTLRVRNIGLCDLSVSNITSSLSVYTPDITSFTVAPGAEQAVVMSFEPSDSITYDGVLTIVSNDALHPNVNVVLQGRGAYPPVLTVSSDSIAATVASGDSLNQILIIGNSGQGPLAWDISSANGIQIENFETGTWPWSPWIYINSGGTAIGDAHEGVRGILDPGWHYRNDVTVGLPQEQLSMWVKAGYGRFHLGFGASSAGAWSLVAGFNTYTLMLQRNSGYGYTQLVSTPQVWVTGTWYKLEVTFLEGGIVECRVYASDGLTLLNTISAALTGYTPGGIAIKGTGGCVGDDIRYATKWLNVTPLTGTIIPGGTQEVIVKFSANDMYGGEYFTNLTIGNNDPFRNPKILPVQIHIVGEPVMSVVPDTVRAGNVYIGTIHVDTVKVKNLGTDVLNVTNITSSLSEFTSDITTFNVPAGGEQAVAVRFVPMDCIVYNGILTITGSDALHPNAEVTVQGQGSYFRYILKKGWNIVSVPLLQPNDSADVLFPRKYGDMLEYSTVTHNYEIVQTVVNGRGYWVYYQDADTNVIGGSPIGPLNIVASDKWIILGSRITPIEISSFILNGGSEILGTAGYEFVSGIGYVPVTVIDPGKGVWVYVTKGCTITFP